MNASPASRLVAVGVGAGMVGLAAWMASPFWNPDPGPHVFWSREILALLAPAVFCCGVVVFLGGAVVGTAILRGRTFFFVGLLMLLFGAFPWIYTPLVIHDHGGEGSGMLGTLIFLFVGLPGLLLTVTGLLAARRG